MARIATGAVLALLVLASSNLAQSPAPRDPTLFLRPAVSLTSAELAKLASGAAVVKSVPTRSPEVAIFAAVRVSADGDRFVAWIREIAELKRGPYVKAIARFSQPPRLADLDALTLDPDDVDAIRSCRPGDCGVKLGTTEIQQLRQAISNAGAGWRTAVQAAFREIVLARVRQYLESGLDGVEPYHDDDDPVSLRAEFEAILANSAFLSTGMPRLDDQLRGFPRDPVPGVESFLYWSKEVLGGKPLVSVTHVNIARGDCAARPCAAVAARQVYASHYMTGSLAVTTVAADAGGMHYLMYLNRSRVDVLDGFFGGLVRRIMERRLRNEAGTVVEALRRRLESGPPPGRW